MKKLCKKFTIITLVIALAMSTCVFASAEDTQTENPKDTQFFGFADNTVPRVVGPYLMTYNPDTRPIYTEITTIPTALGDIKTSVEGEYNRWFQDFFKSHRNLYAFYPETIDNTQKLVLTMPEGVRAFTFGLIPNAVSPAEITAITDDGTEFKQNYLGIENNVSTGFAFYSPTSDIKTITISLRQEDYDGASIADGFAIGDILVNTYDLRKDFTALTKEYTGADFSQEALNAVDKKALALKLLKEYGILKDMKLTQNGVAVSEAKEVGKYDLEVTVDNINQDALVALLSDYNIELENLNEEAGDKVLEFINDIAEYGYDSEHLIAPTSFVVKDYLTINAKSVVESPEDNVIDIPKETVPIAPVENPKTSVEITIDVLGLLVSASVIMVSKKKAK